MKTGRLTPMAVLLTAVLALGAGVTKAQETVRFTAPSSVPFSTASDRIIVTGVTVSARTFDSQCMADAWFGGLQQGGKLVAVHTGLSPAATLLTAYYSKPLAAGTRIENVALMASCNEPDGIWEVYEGTIAPPKNIDVALVTTPAGITLTEDHEGVVGAGTDEFGIGDAVCVKKGSQSIKTPLISDTNLEAGDRLTDFFEVDYDPDSGETTYACSLEY